MAEALRRRLGGPAVPAACVAVFLLCALPGLDRPGFHHEEAFQAVDGLMFADQGARSRIHGFQPEWLFGRLPWMTLPYIGAPKAYLYAALFKLFGPLPGLLRGLSVALGAAAVLFSVLLAQGLFGNGVAFGLGLWMATDPALVLISRYDAGPCMFTMALKMAALYALWTGAGRDSRRLLFLGGLLSGLCLWDKAHFLWWLAAFAVAYALLLPGKPARGRWAPVSAGLALGAAPFLLYNTVHPLGSFAYFESLRSPDPPAWLAGAWNGLPGRWTSLLRTFDASDRFATVSGAAPAALPLRALAARLWLAAAAALAAFRWAREGRRALAPAAFWALASLLLAAAAFLTPLNVTVHHLFLLYPLPYLAIAALLAGAAPGARFGRWPALAAASLLAPALTGNLLRLSDFRGALARTGGAPHWFEGLAPLTRVCLEQGGRVAVMDCMGLTPLVIGSGGRLEIDERLRSLFDSESGAREARLPPGALLVTHPGAPPQCDPGDSAARRFTEAQARRGALRLVARIPYPNRVVWAEVYRVVPPR